MCKTKEDHETSDRGLDQTILKRKINRGHGFQSGRDARNSDASVYLICFHFDHRIDFMDFDGDLFMYEFRKK